MNYIARYDFYGKFQYFETAIYVIKAASKAEALQQCLELKPNSKEDNWDIEDISEIKNKTLLYEDSN